MRPTISSSAKARLITRGGGHPAHCGSNLARPGHSLSVSSLIEDYYDIRDVFLSLPTIIDRGGVEHILRLKLNDEEISGLRRSAQVLHDLGAQNRVLNSAGAARKTGSPCCCNSSGNFCDVDLKWGQFQVVGVSGLTGAKLGGKYQARTLDR
jgi:hypothetical protein